MNATTPWLDFRNLCRRPSAWLMALAAIALLVLQYSETQYLFIHANWLRWSDQGHYMDAVRAWASLDLDPRLHHYPPGYALMGVPFLPLFPLQPFLIPDLICSVASLLLFCRICGHLAPTMRHAQPVAALCFLVATSGTPTLRAIWAQPWTTTAACPFLLAMILLALRLPEQKIASHTLWNAVSLGLVTGLAATIRPSDAALLALPCVCFAALERLRKNPGKLALFRIAAAGCAGLVIGLLPFAIAQIAIFGLGASDYLGHSAALGFEWRLIPMRWVLLVVGPRPLLPEGTGMQAAFLWIWPGVAGMIASLFAPGHGRRANALVAITVIAYWLVYLAYRDLHPSGLWRFNNVHYFKWTLPFLLFWSCLLVREWVNGTNRLAATAALAASIMLFTWRPIFQPTAQGQAVSPAGNEVTIPAALDSIGSAIAVQASGTFHDLYFTQPDSLRIAGQTWPGVGDVKLFPGPGGGLLVPLRPLPPGAVTLTLPAPAGFPAHAAWQAGRQRLVFGLPCLLMPRHGDCVPGAGAAWHWLQQTARAQ